MDHENVYRMLVIGSQKSPMIKVMSILSQDYHNEFVFPLNQQLEDELNQEIQQQHQQIRIALEYIPCIANFGSYELDDDKSIPRSKRLIRYLMSMDYYGLDCRMDQPQTLLPFFDSAATMEKLSTTTAPSPRKVNSEQNTIYNDDIDDYTALFSYGIIGAIVLGGTGIDETCENDRNMIVNFIQMMSCQRIVQDDIKWIKSSPTYQSMKDEMHAYKQCSIIEKEKLTSLRIMGPAKMAQFVNESTFQMIQQRMDQLLLEKQSLQEQNEEVEQPTELQQKQNEDVSSIPDAIQTKLDETINDTTERIFDNNNHNQVVNNNKLCNRDSYTMTAVNLFKDHYACRKCRMALYGVDDLQDPSHVPSKHAFSYRKQKHGSVVASPITKQNTSYSNHIPNNSNDNRNYDNTSTTSCQSYFLQQPLDWMNTDDNEGKLLCPSCDTKIGYYSWSGAQCSCGTWISPAIQIHKSKVDWCLPSSMHNVGEHVVSGNDDRIRCIHNEERNSEVIIDNRNIVSINGVPYFLPRNPLVSSAQAGTIANPYIQGKEQNQ